MIRRNSNHWKFWLVLFPIIGTCALANFQGPGGMRGFFASWYGTPQISQDGLFLWIDPSKESSVTLNGTNISSIINLSSGSIVVTQTNTANQPIYATATRNGLNTIRFIASSQDYFNITSNTIPSSYTVFKVIHRPQTGINSIGFGTLLIPEYYDQYWYFSDNVIYQKDNASLVSHGANTSTGWFYIVTRRNANSEMLVKINGTNFSSRTTGGASTSPTGYWSLIGGGHDGGQVRYTEGNIGEFIAYNRSLSSNEVVAVESYLRTKWGF